MYRHRPRSACATRSHGPSARRGSTGAVSTYRLTGARREYDEARRAVVDWMTAEGKRGRLRRNDECPHWLRYEQALDDLEKARFEHEAILLADEDDR